MEHGVLSTIFLIAASSLCSAAGDGNNSKLLPESSKNATTFVVDAHILNQNGSGTQQFTTSKDLRPKFKHVKFDDDWAGMYPDCSPEKNKHLSPVNLDTDKAVEVGQHARTLLIYAFEPIENYSLQTWYNDTENNITMSALTITLDDWIFFEGTYINGLGFDEFKLFRRAVFFMSTSGLRPGQSHHQINGKTYPMEIMMTFTNRKSDKNTVKNTTQVFILVEIQKYDNPNFFPVIEAAKAIHKIKSKSAMIKNLTAILDAHSRNLTNLTEIYSKSGNGGEVEKLKPLLIPIETAMKQIQVNIKYKSGVEEALNHTNLELESHHYLKDYQTATGESENHTKTYAKILEDLQAKPNDKDLMSKKEELEWTLEVNRRHLSGFGPLVGSLMYQRRDYTSTIASLDEENSKHNAFLDNIINEIQGDKPQNGTMLLAFIKKQVKLKAQIVQLGAKINATRAELAKTEKAMGWKERIGIFHVTWLMPDRGGIYLYNGSDPLPPCNRIRYTVVLQHPVGISQEQYDILAKIPTYEGYESVGEKVAPRLGELGPRPVWSNAKNIQWQRDDGIHMKSIVRHKIKKELKGKKMAAG